MQGVFLDASSLDAGDLNMQALENVFQPYTAYPATTPAQLAGRVKGAQVLISNKVVLDANTLDNCPDLKLICVAATGYNNIDLEAAQRNQIAVCNVTHYATPSVTQHVFSLLLRLVGSANDYQAAINRGDWSKSAFFCLLDYPVAELSGLTMGIIGYGELGRATARLAECFGMNVLIAQGHSVKDDGRIPLEDLLRRADVVSLHCPLTDETRNLIDQAEFKLMKPGAILINTARGGIVNEAALLHALQSKQIAAAGVDVLAQEPPDAAHPLLNAGLSNLIITPHIAWSSKQARQRLTDELVENIKAFQAGTSRNRIV